jgi:hypothetical protein
MERPTRTLETAGGHKIVMYTYMTGGEFEQMQDVYLKKMEIGRIEKDGANISGVTGSVATEANHLALRAMVVSVNDKTDDVLTHLRLLPVADYREVLAAVEAATADKKK